MSSPVWPPSNLPWFTDLTFQAPMQYFSLQHRTLLLSPVPSTTGYCFCFGSIPSFFLELFLHWSPAAYQAPTGLGSSSFSVLYFFLFILFIAMVFSSGHVWMWELGYKESWAQKNWCFWTVVLENTLESPLDCKKIKSVNSKGNQPRVFIGRTDVEAETPTLATWCKRLTHWKRPWCWERLGVGEMVGWHHWHNGHEFELALEVGDRQGSLVCCSLWGFKELDMTEWLNWTESSLPFISFLPPFLLPSLLVHWFRWGASESLYYNWEKSYTYENII